MTSRRLSIAIVTWNSEHEIAACLDALGPLPDDWELRLVDNASADRTRAIVAERYPWVLLLSNETNRGFAQACNRAIAEAASEFVLLLNPDTECPPEAVRSALLFMAERPRCGVLGVRLVDGNGATQPSCFRFPSPGLNLLQLSGAHRLLSKARRARLLLGSNWDHAHARPVDWVLGAFMLVRRRALADVGPMSEDYFLFAEDIDWCRRFWEAGHEVWFTPAAAVLHHGGRSTGALPSRRRDELALRGKYRFCAKHYGAAATRLVQLTDVCAFALRTALDGRSEWMRNSSREAARQLLRPLPGYRSEAR